MSEQFTSQEQALIERLGNAPQPDLSQTSFEAIRAQMLNAMDAPPVPAPRPGFTPALPVMLAVGIVVVIVVVVIIVASGASSPPVAPTPTTAPTFTAVPSLTPSASETPVSSLTPTPEVTQEATPEITPETTEEAVIVIEGPVESINGNQITIFGVTIQLNPSDPILQTIQVGDVLHVEGNTGTTVIVAITVTYVNVEVNVNPSNGEVWRDNGNCDHPPPDWAPANGWRRRCQGQTQNGNGNNNGNGNGNGMGMGDD